MHPKDVTKDDVLCLHTNYKIEFKFTKYAKNFDHYQKTKLTYPYIFLKLVSSTYYQKCVHFFSRRNKNKLATSCLDEEL
jgi:hypothetical protein